MWCQLGLRSGKEPHSSAAGFNPCLQPQLVCWEESEGCAEVPNPLPQVEPAPFCRSPAILCQQVVPMPPLSKPFPWRLRGLARACTPHLGTFLCSPCLLNSLCSVAKVALAQKGGGGEKNGSGDFYNSSPKKQWQRWVARLAWREGRLQSLEMTMLVPTASPSVSPLTALPGCHVCKM